MFHSKMYRDLVSTSQMHAIWSDYATVSAWLRIEQNLAAVQAEKGLIPHAASTALATITPEDIDIDLLSEKTLFVGRPIVGLVKQLRDQLSSEHSASIHYGTTTQDIMDTATVLQMQAGLAVILQEVGKIIKRLDILTIEHTNTQMIGRTNGQFAKPVTFAMKTGLWSAELKRRIDAINDASTRGLQVQFGGPVGTLDTFDKTTGLALRKAFAKQLGLNSSELTWQNSRDGLGDIILAIGQLGGSIEKITHNVNLLSSSGIAELYETPVAGKGASSSMSHKRNQRCSEFGEALGRLMREKAIQVGSTGIQEHERSGGACIAEWVLIPEVFLISSGALKWTKQLFNTLHVDSAAMLENLQSANRQIDARPRNS